MNVTFVTGTTGHSSTFDLNELAPEAVEACAALVDQIVAAPPKTRGQILDLPYSVGLTVDGRRAIYDIAGSQAVAGRGSGGGEVPVLMGGVCADDAEAAELWQMHQAFVARFGRGLFTWRGGSAPPPAPWLCTIILPSRAPGRDMALLADFQRCLAAGFLAHLGG